ncbi:TPA: BrnA antitoxin family protein [Mannheimia haemolytica]|nr:BrnA antitoxin family protein [Mannheimia haemolytica]HDZ6747612.1 BrnA antitoxin family protein [Mannheimia haemolytica]HDZ6813797.1 BrnA antitoxin family protein [Mannheimia haemolytica]
MKPTSRQPLLDNDGEVRELTSEDFALARPLVEVMPPDFVEMVLNHQSQQEALGLIKAGRGKQKAPTKQAITIRLSAEVVEAFKATGKGWQSRINEALLKHVHTSM